MALSLFSFSTAFSDVTGTTFTSHLGGWFNSSRLVLFNMEPTPLQNACMRDLYNSSRMAVTHVQLLRDDNQQDFIQTYLEKLYQNSKGNFNQVISFYIFTIVCP